jgi:2-amino-4-hydroxy-6-hydroxymethyldihydropteridine diphosphokinase
MPETAYIALGSNLGDRAEHLNAALAKLRQAPGIQVKAVSRYWTTTPVGGPAKQDDYLNAAAALDTSLTAYELLQLLLGIEGDQGRIRNDRFGPRTLDLDILLYGDRVIHEPHLTVPHPRLHERAFMLGPLAEIAPSVVHPIFGRTIAELLAQVGHRPLLGKRALVTGSSSGIGKAIALKLAEQGADVLVHAGKSQSVAQEVAKQILSTGRQSDVLVCNLRDRERTNQLVQQAWDRWKGLEICICNAGADILTGAQRRLDYLQKLETLLDVDLIGTVILARAIGQRMKETGQGVILTMGWDQATTGFDGESGELFSTAKAAVMAFTRSLALNLAPQVRVNCLSPGWIKTAWGENAPSAWQERALAETPLGRWGTPEDVAKTACWLVGPDAEFITGQVVRINGGAV